MARILQNWTVIVHYVDSRTATLWPYWKHTRGSGGSFGFVVSATMGLTVLETLRVVVAVAIFNANTVKKSC